MATTLKKLNEELMDAENRAMELEEFEGSLEEMLDVLRVKGELPKEWKEEKDTLTEIEKTIKAMAAKVRREGKKADALVDKLEVQVREKKAEGCTHDDLQCSNCGKAVVKVAS